MAKKEKFAKNKNGKVPFAVLRKGALCALLGTTVLAGGALVGCDEGSFSGPPGAKFYYGAEEPDATKNPGKNGDFYIETADGDVWQYQGNDGWIHLTNIRGPQGESPDITISEDGYWVINGFKTDAPAQGEDGEDAQSPTVEIEEGYWIINGVKSDVKAEAEDGKSAFDLAVEHEGFKGTVAEWLASLKGAQGERGYYVTSISEVKDDNWGISSHFEFTLNDENKTVVSTESVSRLMPNYYYGATTGAEVLELIELGAENIQIENDVDVTEAIVLNGNLSIDLNNHTFTYSNGSQIVVNNGIELEFKDGEMVFESKGPTTSSIKVQGGSSLVLDCVEYISAGTNVMVIEDATSVKVVDSHLTGAVYCVGTNALTEKNFGVKIEIDDCELDTTGYEYKGEYWYDTTPILINIPCEATIKDSKITGHRQAVIVRGGNVVIEDCTLISTGKDYIKGLGLVYNTEAGTWGTGNAVPFATLVSGNDGKGIYANYSTNLDLINVDIISQKMSLGVPTIWIGGGNAEGNGLTVNYSAKQVDESFVYGMSGNGENFVINVEVNNYDMLLGLTMISMESQGKIMPKLTRDILAYDYQITVEKYMEVQEVRAILSQMGFLDEFDVWTMFNEEEVYVESMDGFVYATEALGLEYSKITLINSIYVGQNGPVSLEDCIKYTKINEQINPNGARFDFYVDTQNIEVGDAELLQEVVNIFGNHAAIRLTNNITFDKLGLVVGAGKDIVIDLNGFTVSAPNDEVGDGVFHVLAGGRLTIEDSTGAGVVDGECICEDGYKMAIWADGGEVIINGGTFTNSSTEGTETQYDLIYASNGGRIEINGGRFDCKTPKWTLNVKNAHKDYTFINVNGGEFKNYDPSASATDENKDNNPPTDFTNGKGSESRVEDEHTTWYVVTNNMGVQHPGMEG